MKFICLKGLKAGLVATGIGLALAGCGRNGQPLPPPGVPEDQAAPFINEYTSGGVNANNSAVDQQAQKNTWPQQDNSQPAKAPAVKPQKTFFLDPLL